MPTFNPIQDYILVRPEPRKQSDVIEVVSNERMNRGTVLACGPGKWLKKKTGLVHEMESGKFLPMTVKVGDFVTYTDLDIFPKYRATPTAEECVIIQEADVCWYERIELDAKEEEGMQILRERSAAFCLSEQERRKQSMHTIQAGLSEKEQEKYRARFGHDYVEKMRGLIAPLPEEQRNA